jgi:hypothetical protein
VDLLDLSPFLGERLQLNLVAISRLLLAPATQAVPFHWLLVLRVMMHRLVVRWCLRPGKVRLAGMCLCRLELVDLELVALYTLRAVPVQPAQAGTSKCQQLIVALQVVVALSELAQGRRVPALQARCRSCQAQPAVGAAMCPLLLAQAAPVLVGLCYSPLVQVMRQWVVMFV